MQRDPTFSFEGESKKKTPSEQRRPTSGRESRSGCSTSDSSVKTDSTTGSGPDAKKEERELVDGEFSREEVGQAAIAVATVIGEGTLVRASEVKSAAWEAVDLSDRSRRSL